MSNPTANWEMVGDQFYRKVKLYDAVFEQDLELENYIIAGAPYGGALGMFAFFHSRKNGQELIIDSHIS